MDNPLALITPAEAADVATQVLAKTADKAGLPSLQPLRASAQLPAALRPPAGIVMVAGVRARAFPGRFTS